MPSLVAVREQRPAGLLAMDWTLEEPRPLTAGEFELLFRSKRLEVQRAVALRLAPLGPRVSWAMVEEAVDSAFERLLGRRVHRPVGWLIVTGYFRALDLLARSEREVPLEWVNGSSAGLWAQLYARKLLAAVGGLPDGQRDALVLTKVAGYSAGEAAAVIGTTAHEVWNRAHRARRKLAAWWHEPAPAQLELFERRRSSEARNARRGGGLPRR